MQDIRSIIVYKVLWNTLHLMLVDWGYLWVLWWPPCCACSSPSTLCRRLPDPVDCRPGYPRGQSPTRPSDWSTRQPGSHVRLINKGQITPNWRKWYIGYNWNQIGCFTFLTSKNQHSFLSAFSNKIISFLEEKPVNFRRKYQIMNFIACILSDVVLVFVFTKSF